MLGFIEYVNAYTNIKDTLAQCLLGCVLLLVIAVIFWLSYQILKVIKYWIYEFIFVIKGEKMGCKKVIKKMGVEFLIVLPDIVPLIISIYLVTHDKPIEACYCILLIICRRKVVEN